MDCQLPIAMWETRKPDTSSIRKAARALTVNLTFEVRDKLACVHHGGEILKRVAFLTFVAGLLLTLGGCKPAARTPQYAPMATLRDVMKSIVEPNADFLWDSVETVATAKQTENKMPRTDEEWLEVHEHAVALVEATNLLLIPNRHIAKPGEKADNPGMERDPQEIEAMISKDRATFLNRIGGLREASLKMLTAVEAKDVTAMEDAGGILDSACETCHTTYWYPPDK
jgi:hypothetical protein